MYQVKVDINTENDSVIVSITDGTKKSSICINITKKTRPRTKRILQKLKNAIEIEYASKEKVF